MEVMSYEKTRYRIFLVYSTTDSPHSPTPFVDLFRVHGLNTKMIINYNCRTLISVGISSDFNNKGVSKYHDVKNTFCRFFI